MDNIDNIYVINLDKSKDRLKQVTDEVNNKLKRDFIRIPAVYGKELSNDDLKKYTTLYCRYFCSPSLIGCALSHMKTWQKCIDNNDEYSLILEDDCQFTDDFLSEFKNVFSELQKTDPNWDFLYLGCLGDCTIGEPTVRDYIYYLELKKRLKNSDKKLNTNHIFIPRSPAGTHAYVISKTGAKKLIEVFNNKVDYHIDIDFLRKSDNFNVYASKKRIAYQIITTDSSTNLTTKFPIILNKLFSFPQPVSYSYFLSMAKYEIFGFPVNSYIILLSLLTFLLPSKYMIMFLQLFLTYMFLELIIDYRHLYYISIWILIIISILYYRNNKILEVLINS